MTKGIFNALPLKLEQQEDDHAHYIYFNIVLEIFVFGAKSVVPCL